MDSIPQRDAASASTPERVALFHSDSREYDPADIIEQALELTAAAQDADRVGVRCLRPLFHADGTPIMRTDRPEQVRAVLAGVYHVRNLRAAALAVAELDGRDHDDPRDRLDIDDAVGHWHSYLHIQRVKADITNRLLPGSRGTVKAAGIDAYTTLPADLDPTPDAEPGRAVEIASDLADVLADEIDPRALLIQQSGRGAYLEVNIEPQLIASKPAPRPIIRDAIRCLGHLVASVGAAVQVDQTVHDPARILRIAGTTNHKPGADPSSPAWILRPWSPSVRALWSAIERLAERWRQYEARQRPPLRLVAGGQSTSSSSRSTPSTSTPLKQLFDAKGWLYGERPDGICDVRCPWSDEHTDGRAGSILFPPQHPGGPGWWHCSHDHCQHRTLADVYAAFGDA